MKIIVHFNIFKVAHSTLTLSKIM